MTEPPLMPIKGPKMNDLAVVEKPAQWEKLKAMVLAPITRRVYKMALNPRDAMPDWVKLEVDAWTSAAQVTDGCVFRAVNRADRVEGERRWGANCDSESSPAASSLVKPTGTRTSRSFSTRMVSRAGLVAVRLIENTQVIDFAFATIAKSASKSVSWRHYGDSGFGRTSLAAVHHATGLRSTAR